LQTPLFYDLSKKLKKLDERDPLLALNQLIDWESFRSTLTIIRSKHRKSPAGRKPFDEVMMFKCLILQHLYNVSDEELEYQIRDRISFCRFLGLTPDGRVPDAKTVWLFREQLTQHELIKSLFYRFEQQLVKEGYHAKKGQILDASIVKAPIQRNSREDNAKIKAGETPDTFKDKPAVERQKDVDARWTKKHGKSHYGYKDHISIDNKHKLIRDYVVTDASVSDGTIDVVKPLICDNTNADVYGDKAYRTKDIDDLLQEGKNRNQILRKKPKNKPVPKPVVSGNRTKSKTRARVEHVFGAMENNLGGKFVRSIGLVRASTKIGLMNLAYNITRFVSLHRMNVSKIGY
jgi:IS5 family transposase